MGIPMVLVMMTACSDATAIERFAGREQTCVERWVRLSGVAQLVVMAALQALDEGYQARLFPGPLLR